MAEEETGARESTLLPSGNAELDRRMGGGLPKPSFTIIEGANDSGKSVLVQQFIKGTLDTGCNVCLITTETTIPTLLEQMEQINLKVLKNFLWGRFRVVPLQLEGTRWTNYLRRNILNDLSKYLGYIRSETIFIDSFTFFATEADESDVLSFLTQCRNLTRHGKSMVLTLHTDSISEDLLTKICALCDCHIKLRIENFAGEFIRVMDIIKFRGSNEPSGLTLSFKVDTAFGLQVLPIEIARA
jgi:flagellar protein FlaH